MMLQRVDKYLNDFVSCENVAAQEWHAAIQNIASFEDASGDECCELLDALLASEISSHARAQAMIELLLQAFVKRALAGDTTFIDGERISLFYRHLGPFSRSRAFLLRLLTLVNSQESLAMFCELLIDDPPADSMSASLGFVTLFQSRSVSVDSLFPRLFDALQHLAVAGLVIDLANYLARTHQVAEHPGQVNKAMLSALLGQVSQRLDHLEETAGVTSEEAKKNQKKISESVSLTVSLCDAVALIGDKAAIPKLNQALELKHRRIRTEAAAALTRLGDEHGKEILIAMAQEPVARLRVLAYASELGLESEIDQRYRTEEALAEAELAVWLAEPTQMGLPPTKLELIETCSQYWPSYEEPRTCWLFQFTYQLGDADYTNVGIVGPVTHAFDVDLRDLSPADIYAMFAGWQTEHEEILEFPIEQLNAQQKIHVDRLLSRVPQEEYQSVAPLVLGAFFGDLTLLAACQRGENQGFMMVDSEQTAFYPSGVSLRPLRAEHVSWLYKGRRLLQAFN